MAISAYVGIPRSGKSYEVVCNVIIPAFMKGRRIVTNIYGISPEKIRVYCLDKKKADEYQFGEIICVDNEQVKEADFFPFKTETGIAEDTFCQAGDLICIDEAWRIWENDRIPQQHRSFIAEHGHFVNEEGITCDLVVLNQSVANLPRFIKDRIETTYRMTKLVALGLRNRYRVDVYSGIKLFKNNRTSSYQCSYDKAIFPLYHSYEGGQGQEQVVDKRQSIFNQSKFWLLTLGLLLLVIASVYFLYQFFGGNGITPKNRPVSESVDKSVTTQKSPQNPLPQNLSAQWRIAGKISQRGQAWVVLLNQQGQIRLEPLSQFRFYGLRMTGNIDGDVVTTYSGGMK